MNGGLTEIRLREIGGTVGELMRSIPPGEGRYGSHYDQNEDFFILLEREVTFPHFPIHHDVRLARPGSAYLEALELLLSRLVPVVPQLFRGLRYFFDPGDVLRPAFSELLEVDGELYLYLVRLDLKFRPNDAEMAEAGSNDLTAAYHSRKLFLEALFIPLEEARSEEGASVFVVRQSISSTWIGETGRGYLVQGIWMDHDLTKFFSRLFVPSGTRFYPYYPFVCRYRTICHVTTHLSPEGRMGALPYLQQALRFLAPEMRSIEEALRGSEFSEALPVYRALKTRVPAPFTELFSSLKVSPYLNEHDMKEFLIEA